MADHRSDKKPVASVSFAQLKVLDGASGGGLIKTGSTGNVNGIIEAIEIVLGTATVGSVTATVKIETAAEGEIYEEASLDDALTHRKTALSNKATQDADFNPAPVNDDLVLTFTADKDPGTSGLTCDVTIFYR